ncbi:MAG TPA: efflux RND transporter permease subunit, partial [Bdellovibrionota bacterium]|nr:efflux RND transporter permease subunit [Bdellovibrionota bacterium]
MKTTQWVMRQRILVNLVTVLVILWGIISLFNLRREAFPLVVFDQVQVTTLWPGASPEEVEKHVTGEIERELKDVDGIKEVASVSVEGRSVIIVTIHEDEPNKDRVVTDIQRAVDRSKGDLPTTIKDDPVVIELTTRQEPVIEVSLTNGESEQALRDDVDTLEQQFLQIDGVAEVAKRNYRDREIWVEVDLEKLKDYYLTISQIMLALASRNLNVSGGTIQQGNKEFVLRTVGEFSTPEEVKKVVIRSNEEGVWTKVEDVASVKWAYEDIDLIEKTNGQSAINLVVIKRESGDAIRIADQVKQLTKQYVDSRKGKIKATYLNDFSYYIKRRLKILYNNWAFSAILVMACLFFFMSPAVAIVTALGVPFAFFVTFGVMAAFGITINLVTMLGLIIVLGMLIDDAIIISENCYRYIEMGMPPEEAAIKGTDEVGKAVIATVLTTCVAFLPLAMMSGIIGKFIWVLPVIVIISLLASLAEALFILPVHIADFHGQFVKRGLFKRTAREMHWFRHLENWYVGILQKVIKIRYRLLISLIILFFATVIFAVKVMGIVLFPAYGIEIFHIRMETPPGTPLEVMEQKVKQMEQIVGTLPKEELDAYVTQVGLWQTDPTDP